MSTKIESYRPTMRSFRLGIALVWIALNSMCEICDLDGAYFLNQDKK